MGSFMNSNLCLIGEHLLMRNKLLTVVFALVVFTYAVITLINQQITLNRYKETEAKLTEQIEKENKYKDELIATKDNVNSEEFIEQMAREKLDMYLPTEKVYVDTGM